MRILNPDSLRSHGNREGRSHAVEIVEAGLQASDPYYNTRRMLRIEDGRLIVGNPLFVPAGSPKTEPDVYDLDRDLARVFVFGAGKGIQRVAAAIEDVLGEYLTGGYILLKYGDEHTLQRVDVMHGAHPIPDENCVEGCRELISSIRKWKLTEQDLVFTVIGNGASSLLTYPAEELDLADVMEVTRIMQIKKGLPTMQVNIVRNQLDQLKGGRITRLLSPAKMAHIIPIDLDEPNAFGSSGYEACMDSNFWLHTLPDMSSAEKAMELLRENDIWEEMPPAIRRHLKTAAREQDVMHREEFESLDCRIFGIMPTACNFIPVAMQTAEKLGYQPHFMMRRTFVEAAAAGALISRIAVNVANENMPFHAPCALLMTGELMVTVDQENGVGGRNQEFTLSAATVIKGNRRIVVAAADTDGTDGPGGRFNEEAWENGCTNLSGGIVDGYTVAEANAQGVDIQSALKTHGTSDALWRLDSGIWATQNISVQDLIVVLIMDHDG